MNRSKKCCFTIKWVCLGKKLLLRTQVTIRVASIVAIPLITIPIQINSITAICLQCEYSNINIQSMSRHRRANSDLYGLKSVKCMKVQSCKESEAVLNNHNMSAYDTKTSQTKKPNCPETPSKKVEAHEMILDTFKLVKHFYQTEETDYYARVKRYLHGQWEGHKKNFNEHLNKLIYMEEEMQKKNYHEIELEIIGEWRKNPVLYCIRVFWYELMGSIKFDFISDFMKRYNLFKDFIGQLAYLYFKRFFKSMGSEKEISKVLDKLSQRSSHLIISYTSSWCKLCDRVVMPLLKLKIQTSVPNIENLDGSKFNLQKLEIQSIAVDYKAHEIQMPKTINSIERFIMEHKILEKIKLLIDVRHHMEEEIRARQEYLIKTGTLKEIKVLDKDDFVDCLIYCVVRGDVSLQKLGLSIKYFYYILGVDTNTILSKFRCDSYLADLEAVFDFLVQEITAENNKKNGNDPLTSENSPA